VPRQQRNDELQDFMDSAFQRAIGQTIIIDSKPSNTNGGTFTAGAWQVRDLTLVQFDTIGVTLAANVFTLPRGVYEVHASAPGWNVNRHMIRLYDVTNAVAVLWGTSEVSSGIQSDIVPSQTRSFLHGRLHVPAATQYRLEHQCQTTVLNVGLGLASGWAFAVDHETFTEVMIHQVG